MVGKSLIVKNKQKQESSDKQPFDFLTEINNWLETVPLRTTNAFENMVGNGEDVVQAKVDQSCRWLSWKINVEIETVRQKVIKSLYQMYQNTVVGKVMQMVNVIKSFVKNPLYNLFKFALEIFAPYAVVIQWYKTLLTEVPRLARNLANIASALPPSPPTPDINFNAFKISVKTISISDVTSNPDNLPLPETMFPEPEKPFTKETFDNMFLTTSAKLKSTKMVYKLGDKDKQALLFSTDRGSTSEIV